MVSTRECIFCGTEFEFTHPNQRYCDDCKEIRRRQAWEESYKLQRLKKMVHDRTLQEEYSLKLTNEVIRDINDHNRFHGTDYSYGQYVGMIRLGKIKENSYE